jgi:hypothetical protein
VFEQVPLFSSEISAAPLCSTHGIVTITRLKTGFDISQHVRSYCVVGAGWRVLNERLDLLSYFTALLEINKRMPVHFDNGIGVGEARVEGGKMTVCPSQVSW